MNVPNFINLKNKEKITMVTCYDSMFANALNQTKIDAVLVGDSVAMVVYGESDTTKADVDMISRHIKAVRSSYKGMIVGDLPFLSIQKSQTDFIEDVRKIISSGANAIKIEGVLGMEDKIKSLIQAGVPVMGHLGLTPQFINSFGGFKVQGKSEKDQQMIFKQAKSLEALGCFSIVLECVPSALSERITEALNIPTIGIGAGLKTDGQVLVLQDLLGLNEQKFKFVKTYENLFIRTKDAVDKYVEEVKTSAFPAEENSFL